MTYARSLENSEVEFAERYGAFAASGTLYPQREGSPLMEFVTGGRVLYLFDRSGPYTWQPGPARLVVHGIVDMASLEWREGTAQESLTVEGISAVTGVGQVLLASRRTCVVQARVPLVLSAFEPLPDLQVGDWLAFRTLPPLHGFVAAKE